MEIDYVTIGNRIRKIRTAKNGHRQN